MSELHLRPVRGLRDRRTFVDVPFRIHGRDPSWIPPLRLSVYDRISPRHPATAHQETALWVAERRGRAVGRIAACVDSAFNAYQGGRWGWVGFFDAFDDVEVTGALFEAAWAWLRDRGADLCLGPASFTTNDELGLLVEGFEDPPAIMTLQNPPYYERLWTGHGWEAAMDLYGWRLDNSAAISPRQKRVLERLKSRSQLRLREVNMRDWDNEVARIIDVYNAAWAHNWAFAPMSEAEVRHLAKQLKRIINPRWVFGLETPEGEAVGLCLTLPDANRIMASIRSGRLFPLGWLKLLRGLKRVDRARVWALGVKPGYESLALGPLLYGEITARLVNEPRVQTAEASWTLATNRRINDQIQALGGVRTKVWRLYQKQLR